MPKNELEVDISKSKLLIVDDEVELVELLAEGLGTLTSNIVKAYNGEESLSLIKRGDVDAVISDIKMPIRSGIQTLGEIRNLGLQTPYVIVTGFGDKQLLIEALRLDATDFIDKPFSLNEVIRVTKRALTFGTLQRQVENEFEKTYANSRLTQDEIAKVKQHKVMLARLRIESSEIKKKAA